MRKKKFSGKRDITECFRLHKSPSFSQSGALPCMLCKCAGLTHTHKHTQTHTHTYTHNHTHMQTHTETHTQSQIHKCTHTQTHTDTHTYTQTHLHTITHRHRHTDTHTHAKTETHTNIHKHTYTQSHTHTHTHSGGRRQGRWARGTLCLQQGDGAPRPLNAASEHTGTLAPCSGAQILAGQ